MALLVDSADLRDAARAAELGFVQGVTTNPTLMRKITDDPLRHLGALLAAVELPHIYYQPCGQYGSALLEAEKAWAQDEERVVLKVPATPTGAALAGTLVRRGAAVSLTAAQSPQAMIVAESIGCASVIPYVDRAQRDLRTDSHLVQALATARRGSTAIVAASVKSPGQLLQAWSDGADSVTAPMDVLEGLLAHPASLEAEYAFAAEYGTRA